MKFNEALDQTLKDYGITAKWLSEEAGISTTAISEFRRGKKSLVTDNLERLLNALPEEVEDYFYDLKRGRSSRIRRNANLQEQLEEMSAQELGELIAIIATKISQVAQKELQRV